MAAHVEKDEVSLKEVIVNFQLLGKYLFSKWKHFLFAIIIGSVLGFCFSLISPPIYVASTTFILQNTKKTSSYAGIASKLGFSLGSDAGGDLFSDDDNIMIFLKSRTLISQTLYSKIESKSNELMVQRYFSLNNFKHIWRKYPALSNIKFHKEFGDRTLLEDSVVSYFHKTILAKNLSVSKPDKEQDLIQISTSTPDEVFSKAFNENLLANATDFYVDLQTKKSLENVNVLQRQVDSTRSLLNSAITGVAISTDANPNLNPAFQRVKVPSQRRVVDVEMNRAILVELVKNLEMAKITLRGETPLVQIVDQPILPLEKKELTKVVGLVLGGLLMGGLMAFYLCIKYYLRRILGQPINGMVH